MRRTAPHAVTAEGGSESLCERDVVPTESLSVAGGERLADGRLDPFVNVWLELWRIKAVVRVVPDARDAVTAPRREVSEDKLVDTSLPAGSQRLVSEAQKHSVVQVVDLVEDQLENVAGQLQEFRGLECA